MNTGSSIYKPKAAPLSTYNTTQGNQALSNLARIAPTLQFDVPPITANLGKGSYPGGLRSEVQWHGIGSDVSISTDLTLSGKCFLTNLTFFSAVNLTSAASVQFVGCIFYKPITVATGGKVSVTGSRLDGSAAVLNAGAIGNAQSVGNIKTSGVANTNCLTIEV